MTTAADIPDSIGVAAMPQRIGIDIHTIGQRQTGNETYMRNLVEHLSAMESPETELFLYHTLQAKALPANAWRANLRKVWPHSPFVRIPFSFPLLLQRDQIDLAHFQYVTPPFCPCPTVVTIHDISYEFFPEYFHPLARARMKMLIPGSARRATRVLTGSEFSKREIVDTYRIPEEKISVTHYGVAESFKVISDQAELDRVLQRFGIRQPFILGVGNLQPRKNLQRLLRAYAALRADKAIDFDLVLVGQMAWKAESILEDIDRLGLAGSVSVTGYVSNEELVCLYNRAQIFVYPSLYEGFGLPIIEAMACGTPVITSDVSSLPEVGGDAAIFVNPQDHKAIADAIKRLADDSALREQLREKGLRRASEFTWRRIAEQTATIYRQCLNGLAII